ASRPGILRRAPPYGSPTPRRISRVPYRKRTPEGSIVFTTSVESVSPSCTSRGAALLARRTRATRRSGRGCQVVRSTRTSGAGGSPAGWARTGAGAAGAGEVAAGAGGEGAAGADPGSGI